VDVSVGGCRLQSVRVGEGSDGIKGIHELKGVK
jgi:hypothetical protein